MTKELIEQVAETAGTMLTEALVGVGADITLSADRLAEKGKRQRVPITVALHVEPMGETASISLRVGVRSVTVVEQEEVVGG
jgi:hypothetical protein